MLLKTSNGQSPTGAGIPSVISRLRSAGQKGFKVVDIARSLVTPVQDMTKFKWAGVPYCDRYCKTSKVEASLLKKIWEIDDLLDLKIFLPTLKWHLVRYPWGRMQGKFVRVWELDDNPDLGLRKVPGEWLVTALKMGDTRGRDINAELDASDERRQSQLDKKIEDDARDFAKEIRKPLKDLLDYGPDKNYKGVF